MRVRLAHLAPTVGALVLAGCVSLGTPLSDVPLVPLPPVPLGAPDHPPPEAPPVEAPVVKPAPAAPVVKKTAQQLHQEALARKGELGSYIVRLTRREVVGGRAQPEEVMLFRFRAHPWSVYFKWLGKSGKGREVVHVKGQYGNKIHSLLAAGDVPFTPAGKRMALAPDSIFVKSACRHPITEAGLAASIDRIGRLLANVAANGTRAGSVDVIGPLRRPEFDKPVLALQHTIPPRFDPTLPQGGKRAYYFCPDSKLPMLVVAHDEKGREVEYYHYDRLLLGVKLDDADFDPERLWRKPDARASR